jgi:RecA-family ATPase
VSGPRNRKASGKVAGTASPVPPKPTAHITQQYVFDPASNPPTERALLEGVLSEGELALWVGREKHRKSSMILLFAVCLALGRAFLSFKIPAPARVVILDYESKPGSLKRRYEAICNALGLTLAERQ